jgi:hypothetical protein
MIDLASGCYIYLVFLSHSVENNRDAAIKLCYKAGKVKFPLYLLAILENFGEIELGWVATGVRNSRGNALSWLALKSYGSIDEMVSPARFLVRIIVFELAFKHIHELLDGVERACHGRVAPDFVVNKAQGSGVVKVAGIGILASHDKVEGLAGESLVHVKDGVFARPGRRRCANRPRRGLCAVSCGARRPRP